MAQNEARPEYSILLTRDGGACVASIPELCIAEKRPTPQEALAAVLQAELEARKNLDGGSVQLPPSANRIDPFPAVTRSAQKYLAFFKQVLIGYVMVACITVAVFVLVFPAVRSHVSQQLKNRDLAADTKKVLTKLGVAVCSDARQP